MVNLIIYLILFTILHPIKSHKLIEHCEKEKHKFNINVHNFNFDIWCADCGEIFMDEIL